MTVSLLLTRCDMDDPENVKDADHELRHCHDDASFARWANRWGVALVAHLLVNEGSSQGQIEAAQTDATKAEENLGDLEEVVNSQVEALDKAVNYLLEPGEDGLDPKKLTDDLELVIIALNEAVA